MQSRLLAVLLVAPSVAWAQFDVLKPPKPMSLPQGREINSMYNIGSNPTCSYVASPTAARPRDVTEAALTMNISADGSPSKADVSESSGSEHLDGASKMCALSWRYRLTVPSHAVATQLIIRWRRSEGYPLPQGESEFVGKPVFDKGAIAELGL